MCCMSDHLNFLTEDFWLETNRVKVMILVVQKAVLWDPYDSVISGKFEGG